MSDAATRLERLGVLLFVVFVVLPLLALALVVGWVARYLPRFLFPYWPWRT